MTHAIHILFQGDSITDVGRARDQADDLGAGYALLASSSLAAHSLEAHLHFTNRGIAGDRVADLQQRWQTDCLDLQPTILSLLIGINDTWPRESETAPTSIADFTATYTLLLEQAVGQGMQIILCEPFLLPMTDEQVQRRHDLDLKIAAIRQLARQFRTRYVPLDGLFAQAATRRELAYWTTDGIHPTLAGHGLIAHAWRDTVVPLVTAQGYGGMHST